MDSHVVVVGAGVAGVAAAIGARQQGARVTVVDGGTGASTLATGAIDLEPCKLGVRSAGEVPVDARALLATLNGYTLPERGATVLTTAGIVRSARGHDASLLDIAGLESGRVAVVHCDRPGWDADALARAWGGTFHPVEAFILRRVDEAFIPDADFAARHDDDARLDWLAERLREALARAPGQWAAMVLPPMLGVERARAHVLSKLVGLRCGEAAGLPGGPAGLRFERARDRVVRALGLSTIKARATRVERSGPLWNVATDDGQTVKAAAVVLATGGLLGGGVAYEPAEATLATALPAEARTPFRLTLDAPVALGAHGRPLEVPTSLFGHPPESIAWPFARDPLIDRVGALSPRAGSHPGLYVAGDLAADAPRLWLAALSSGIRAGAAAARHAVTSGSVRSPLPGEAPASRP
jgi:glycerol-3-phosphate dehydrogenase subunit B